MIRRRIVPLACAATLVLALAGCGGGGGGGGSASQGDVPPPQNAVPIATGAGPDDSATLAMAALGNPVPVPTGSAGPTLQGYDTFGTPHDPFAQQVKMNGLGSGSEATVGQAPLVPTTPITSDPLVAVPGGTGTNTGGNAGGDTGAPVQNPVAYQADFDISGEPVLAIEGDAIPPETQQFEVTSVTADTVVLTLVGGLLPDGSDTVTLHVKQSITLFNATAGKTYTIKLVDIRRA